MVIRLPDDGTGALPLIRQIILNDSKDSTYKLALLRTLCRIAEGAAGYARSVGDDQTSVPLGLVGLYWLRLYIPLLQQGLPQRANNRGLANLGFVKEAYRSLADIAARELRVGMTFASRGEVLRSALSDAITTIKDMPVTFITYADGRAIFGVLRRRVSPTSTKVRLDEAFLSSFGEFLIPTSLWLALQRYTAWIEPAIEAEWGRLMLRYSAGQGKTEAELKSVREVISTAMSWPESTREVKLARAQALSLLSREPLKCVWSGRYLTAESLHIDHCLPFALWPCDDLWNLLPTHQRENGRKSDRVPSADLLRRQRDQILGWWDKAYCTGSHTSLHEQFTMEARATLPGIGRSICGNDDIFSGLILQQMRLRHDQQAPLWDGPR
jgi:hypothetical protein